MNYKKAKRRAVAERLRKAITSGRVTREAVMGATMRCRRSVDYWLSGEMLPPPTVCDAIEGLCK